MFKAEFISFLTYIIKTKLGVTVQEENGKVEINAFLNASNWDKECRDLSINAGASDAFMLRVNQLMRFPKTPSMSNEEQAIHYAFYSY